MKWIIEGWLSIGQGLVDALRALVGVERVDDEPVVTITLREFRSYQDRIEAQQKLIREQNAMIDELRALTRRGL